MVVSGKPVQKEKLKFNLNTDDLSEAEKEFLKLYSIAKNKSNPIDPHWRSFWEDNLGRKIADTIALFLSLNLIKEPSAAQVL